MIGEDPLDLGGQIAFVTGAGQGAGRAIALALAHHNAGGVAVSYLEWVQNIEHHSWSLAEVNAHLLEHMTSAVDRVVARWQTFSADAGTSGPCCTSG